MLMLRRGLRGRWRWRGMDHRKGVSSGEGEIEGWF